MTRKHEVGSRRQHVEAERGQAANQVLAAGHHCQPGLVKMRLVLDRRGSADDRHAVQRIGVEAVLDPFQRRDQVRMTDRKADPQPGQRARFGQGLHHQQVRVARHQRDRAVAAKVDIGLVHDHHAVGLAGHQPFHLGQRQQAAGRGVRIRENDAAGGLVQIIVDPQRKVLGQRHQPMGDLVQAAIGRIKTVADVREQDGVLMLQQGLERMRQHFVGTVADKHVGRRYPVRGILFRQRQFQRLGIRIGVQPQVVAQFGAHGCQRQR